MVKVGKDTTAYVESILTIKDLEEHISEVFKCVEKRYGMNKEEFLILLTLWRRGSMSLKEMDEFVRIKFYKRTKTYNGLVAKKWIRKERPQDDERTVLIHFNEDFASEKESLIAFAKEAIKQRSKGLKESLDILHSM